MPPTCDILYFSRGRGRGHAVRDLVILQAVHQHNPNLQIQLVSYATGAATLRAHGRQVIDLEMPENNGIAETTVPAGKLTGWLQPKLVVAHEEFAALPAAKIFDKRTLFITSWFSPPNEYAMRSLIFADEIYFLDDAGVYEEPPWVTGRVRYPGPIIRPFQYTLKDRVRARRELGLRRDALIITMLPGSWRESQAPALDLVLQAFDHLPGQAKLLVWLAGADREVVAEATGGREDVLVLGEDWQIDRLVAASDILVTKANRQTLLELDALGRPSLSLSHALNPMDDFRSRRLPLNRHLEAPALTPGQLAHEMAALRQVQAQPARWRSGADTIARAVAEAVRAG